MSGGELRRADRALWREGIDRVVVLMSGDDSMHTIDLTGPAALIWIAVDEPSSLDTLRERVREFMPDGSVDDEFDHAIELLVTAGLLQE